MSPTNLTEPLVALWRQTGPVLSRLVSYAKFIPNRIWLECAHNASSLIIEVSRIFQEWHLSLNGLCLHNLKKMSQRQKRYTINKSKYLLPPELDRLRQILRDFYTKDYRNCLIIDLALCTGGRAQEILNLRKQDLQPFEETVLIRGLKNSNDRELPIPHGIFVKLMNYSNGVEGERLFPITYHRLHQIWELYRPVPKKFHCLRHTFAIELYKKTKDVRVVQLALGHRNIMNTMIYADYVYSTQELRKLLL